MLVLCCHNEVVVMLCHVGLYCIELLLSQVTANELTNGVINAAFMLLFKDLIRLFACYNDGIINLLGKLILL